MRTLIHLRRQHRVFSRPRFFRGEVLSEAGLKDITWVTPAGVEATDEDWGNPVALSLGYVLGGAAGEFYTPGGQRDIDESFLVMMNAYYGDLDFHFPHLPTPLVWEALVDTAEPTGLVTGRAAVAAGRSLSAARRIPLRCSSTARPADARCRGTPGQRAGDPDRQRCPDQRMRAGPRPMSRLDELRHVAGLLGIATRHVDALGVVHEPDEETLSRLIAAFGLPDDPQQAAEALAEEDRGGAVRSRAGADRAAGGAGTRCWRLRLPAGASGVEWHCQLEDGGRTRRAQRRRRAAPACRLAARLSPPRTSPPAAGARKSA